MVAHLHIISVFETGSCAVDFAYKFYFMFLVGYKYFPQNAPEKEVSTQGVQIRGCARPDSVQRDTGSFKFVLWNKKCRV